MHTMRVFTSLAAASLLVTPCSEAQSQAWCRFKFSVPPAPYNAAFDATGINPSNTVVGTASTTNTTLPPWKAFIRYPGGRISWLRGSQSQHHGPE